MSRQKNTVKNSNVGNNQEQLSPQQVKEVLEFAEGLYSGSQSYNLYGAKVYTPWLVNEQMKNVSLNSLTASADKVAKALDDPKGSEMLLEGYSEYYSITSMLYKRIMLYYATLLNFNLSIICKNASPEDYQSKEYQRDYAKVKEFLGKFDVEREFQKVTKMLVRDEVYYCAFWNDGDRYRFQQLPSRYCLTTGMWEYGFVFDFNMLYFIEPAINIDMFPEVFKEYWNRVFPNGVDTTINYTPANPANARDSAYMYMTQTDPSIFWQFKFDTEVATRIPFLSALMPDIALQPLMRELQKNQNMLKASKIISGQVPFLKNQKGGVVSDAVAMNPATLEKFLSVFNAGLSDLTRMVAAPLENIHGIEFQYTDSDVYEDYNKSIASMSGNSRLLFSIDKQNAVESQLAANMDENIVKPLYEQFEKFLEYNINSLTTKFKFKFKLSGFNTFTDRKERNEKALQWAEKGVIIPDNIAHALGFNNRIELESTLEMVQATDFVGKLSMLPNMFNQKDSSAIGRPSKSDGDISDSGMGTTNGASNDNKV